MPRPPDRRNLLAEMMAEKLRGTPVAAAMGDVKRTMVDENPPVKALADLLRSAGPIMEMADPFGAQAIAMPLKMPKPGGGFMMIDTPSEVMQKQMAERLRKNPKAVVQQQIAADVAARKAARASGQTSLFKSVGFRNKNTGEVVEGGISHPSSQGAIPESWINREFQGYGQESNIEDGFIGWDGKFYTREEAAKVGNNPGLMWKGKNIGLESSHAAQEGLLPVPGANQEERLANWARMWDDDANKFTFWNDPPTGPPSFHVDTPDVMMAKKGKK